MKVFLRPTGLYSQAMVRIANALSRYAPEGVYTVNKQNDADLVIMYVIGFDALEAARQLTSRGQRHAVVQCCMCYNEYTQPNPWSDLWRGAQLVWSYHDLSQEAASGGFDFYHSPLGVDDSFIACSGKCPRHKQVITTGYVTGEDQEAIEEVWIAAHKYGLRTVHVGPHQVVGASDIHARKVQFVGNVSDGELARLYRESAWVAALRHSEGFELPAAEGLACGARPLVFDQPTMRHWYGSLPVYLPDIAGESLVVALEKVFKNPPSPVSDQERQQALAVFDWQTICRVFWNRLSQTMEAAA